MDESQRGTTEEVDALNALGWLLVPVDVPRGTELLERGGRLASELSYELGVARSEFGARVLRLLQGRLRRGAHEGVSEWRRSSGRQGGPRGPRQRSPAGGQSFSGASVTYEVALDALFTGVGDIAMELRLQCRGSAGRRPRSPVSSRGSAISTSAIELHRRRRSRRFAPDGATAGRGTCVERPRDGATIAAVSCERAIAAQCVSSVPEPPHRKRAGGGTCAQRSRPDVSGDRTRRRSWPRKSLETALAIRERLENWPAVVTTLLALGGLHNDEER